MKIRDVDHFFEQLDRRLTLPIEILLTGGAAAILQGVERATLDIDFEVTLKKGGRKRTERWTLVQLAIEETARATGITPEYEEDIDRWSSIALPGKKSRFYRNFGKVKVRILEPGLWAIGKLTRYLSSDVQDLRKVLPASHTGPNVVKLWGTALGISPASSAQMTFRKQVESFLDTYTREIWGANTDPSELKRTFLESALKAKTRSKKQGRARHR